LVKCSRITGVVITMGLNNRGWGLGVFLLFLAFLFLILLLIANMTNTVGEYF